VHTFLFATFLYDQQFHLFIRQDADKVHSATVDPAGGLKRTASKTETLETTPSKQGKGAEAPTPGSKTTTSHLARLTPKQGILIKEKQATDFFGRVIKVIKVMNGT
jgi:hypothetical protein